VEGAKLNLATEIPHWDFEKVYQNNLTSWEKYLNKIRHRCTSAAERNILYFTLPFIFTTIEYRRCRWEISWCR
jgi:putative alpha-1,2-mannosidase